MSVHRNLGDGLFQTWRSLDADLAVAKLQIARASLEHVASDAEQLLLDHAGCTDDGARYHHCVATAARTGAGKPVIGVRVSHANVVGIDLELLGEDHGRHGLGTVAPEWRIQRHYDLAQ